MTGPGLPENGVTLTDVTQRADQGQFTVVDVGSNQQWTMTWDTARLQSQIDPGTYTVYVVNAPVDKSQLPRAQLPDPFRILKRSRFADLFSRRNIVYDEPGSAC